MTVPVLRLTSFPALSVSADVLVLGVSAGRAGAAIAGIPRIDGVELEELQGSLAAIGFSGNKDEFRRIPAVGGSAGSVALVGLGSETPDAESLRYAAGTAARLVRGAGTIAIALPTRNESDVLALLEGAAIGAYTFAEYRSVRPESSGRAAGEFLIVTDLAPSTDVIAKAVAVATAVHTVRDLVNTPPSDLYPETFATAASALAVDLPVQVTVLLEPELKEGGFGGLLGVGQGSTRGPRMVKVTYSPTDASFHLAFVGKGITFDTGGLSLKPPASMVGMKYDMTGAATALAVVLAAAKLGLPVRLTAWLCLAENMPSGSATRPNDVLRIRGGTTVEVLNTDAEGRLVLADGLVAASEEHPDGIIDIATLTGAAAVAMGTRYVAVMGSDDLVRRVVSAADRTGETFWPMPLPAELRALLDSDVADIANAKIGNTAGGMLLAGVFLREFVGKSQSDESHQIPWAHLDIAGAANNGAAAYGYVGKGPTGVAVRALLELAEEFSQE